MPKMIVSIDGVVIKEVQLTKERTTVGRRPYNDVVIDNLAVSGEHAAVQMAGNDVLIEDLSSTNGTYVNGKAIKKQSLNDGDSIEVGKYKIKFINEAKAGNFDKTMVIQPGQTLPKVGSGTLKVLSGAAAGREMPLTKVVTTIGKPGVAVAAITRRQHGFVVAHVEGGGAPTLNGTSIGTDPVALKSGDMIELAGTKMQFVQT